MTMMIIMINNDNNNIVAIRLCNRSYLVLQMLQRRKSGKVHIKFCSRTQAFMLAVYRNYEIILRYFCDPFRKKTDYKRL